MTDYDRPKSDQANAGPENAEKNEPGPDRPLDPDKSSGRAAGSAKKRALRTPALLLGLLAVIIVVFMALMWLTPNDHFLLNFSVKAEPMDNMNGWFIIRPEAGQGTDLFTLAVAREAELVQVTDVNQAESRAEGPLPPPWPAPGTDAAQEASEPSSAFLMVGCVEGQIMPPTFAFSQLIPSGRDQALPHPPKPCAFRYRVDQSEELNASCIFDGIVASLVPPPGPKHHLQDPGRTLLDSAEQGRRLTVHIRVDAGRALTAHFDVSQLALAQARLQRACDRHEMAQATP